VSTHRNAPSPVLGRHLSVSHLQVPLFPGWPPSMLASVQKSTSLELRALQRFLSKPPFFSLSVSKCVQECLPPLLEVPPPGFGYPLGGFLALLTPWESLSIPYARGLCSSELCSFFEIEKRSPSFLSAPALSYETSKLRTGAPAVLLPRKKPCSSLLPDGLSQVGAACSLELSTSRGSLP